MKPTLRNVVSEPKTAASAVNRFEGFGRVASYRLYGLDGVKKVASAEWIEAESDADALEAAKEMMDGHDCELWQGKRLIARIPRKRED